MNAKNVPVTAFVNPALRAAIKTIAAQQQTTVRALIEAELIRITNRANKYSGKPNEAQ
jgi:hypothetical protein